MAATVRHPCQSRRQRRSWTQTWRRSSLLTARCWAFIATTATSPTYTSSRLRLAGCIDVHRVGHAHLGRRRWQHAPRAAKGRQRRVHEGAPREAVSAQAAEERHLRRARRSLRLARQRRLLPRALPRIPVPRRGSRVLAHGQGVVLRRRRLRRLRLLHRDAVRIHKLLGAARKRHTDAEPA